MEAPARPRKTRRDHEIESIVIKIPRESRLGVHRIIGALSNLGNNMARELCQHSEAQWHRTRAGAQRRTPGNNF